MPSTFETITVPRANIRTRGHHISRWAKEFTFHISTFLDTSSYIHCLNPSECLYCSEHVNWEREGDTFIVTTECEYPEGVTYTVNLEVPSGRIVFKDSLFNVFDQPDYDEAGEYIDYNSALGRKTFARLMEKQGVAYGGVGNTSPSVYLDTTNNTITVGYVEEGENEHPILPENWVELGHIITDLWAYSITDYNHYIASGGNIEADRVVVADVPAGIYMFTHYADKAGFEPQYGERTIFAAAEYLPL